MTADARFFFSALEGLSDAEVERTVLPFPSHEVDPLAGWRRISTSRRRARVLCTRSRPASAGWWWRPPHRFSRGSARRSAWTDGASTLTPGQDISPTTSRRSSRGRGLHASGSGRRKRRILRSRRRRRLLSGRCRRTDQARVRRRHDRIHPRYDPSTQRSTAGLDQAAVTPLQELLATTTRLIAPLPPSTTCGPTAGRRCSCPSRRTRPTRKLTQQILASYDETAERATGQHRPQNWSSRGKRPPGWLDGATALEGPGAG